MSSLHKRHLIRLLIIVTLMAVLLPVVFGEPRHIADQTGGDNWRNFVYDFQTLISGVLAIGAAFFTIKSGQKIDENQQIRHEQILELQTRPDKLKIARAYTTMQAVKNDLVVIRRGALPDFVQGGDLDQPKIMAIAVLRFSCIKLLSALTSDKMTNIQHLFDGELQAHYHQLIEALTKYSDNVLLLGVKNGDDFKSQVLPGIHQDYVMDDEHRGIIRRDVVSRHPMVCAALEKFDKGFLQLLKLYKVI